MHVIEIAPNEIFQALADPTRIRLVRLLAVTLEEACLCEFVDSLLEPEYKLSRHVKCLRQVGLLSAAKEGRWVYHSLVNGEKYLHQLYAFICALPDEGGVFASDEKRFRKRLRLRNGGRCTIGIQAKDLSSDDSREPQIQIGKR